MGCRASSEPARDLTANTSVTSSHASDRASSRRSTWRLCGLVSHPSRVRRSTALMISTCVHTHVTISLSSASQERTVPEAGSETISGTSADASQYLIHGPHGPRPTPRRGPPGAPEGLGSRSLARRRCPVVGVPWRPASAGFHWEALRAPSAWRQVCRGPGPGSRRHAGLREGSERGWLSARRPIPCSS